MLEPKNAMDDGIILEFKVSDPAEEKNLEDTAKSAIRQILDKRYAAALEAKGAAGIRIYGFAFCGKNVFIDGGYLSEYPECKNL